MRKPPTFHHLPQVRAKKLKKVWVAKEKTKSKWKAQKRREGILTQRDALLRSSTPLTTPQTSKAREERGASADGAESDEPSDEQQISSEAEPTLTASVQEGTQKPRGREEDVPLIAISGPPLRELQKQAYSPASLHHYKSRPLRHSKGRMATHDVKAPGSSRKEDVGESTRNRSRRGGQPDMRLRMSAMLEKIKRDHS